MCHIETGSRPGRSQTAISYHAIVGIYRIEEMSSSVIFSDYERWLKCRNEDASPKPMMARLLQSLNSKKAKRGSIAVGAALWALPLSVLICL
jgi:hypothetical protein